MLLAVVGGELLLLLPLLLRLLALLLSRRRSLMRTLRAFLDSALMWKCSFWNPRERECVMENTLSSPSSSLPFSFSVVVDVNHLIGFALFLILPSDMALMLCFTCRLLS